MPEVELSTLSGPELRSLLNSARTRGQAAASYQILQEMAERREGRRSDPPRIVSLDLGDPMAGDDEPAPEMAAEPEAEAEAPLYISPPPGRSRRKAAKPEPAAAPPPASVWDDAPEAPAPRLQGLPHPGRPGFARAAVFAAGIVIGGGAGWGAANLDLGRLAPPAAASPPADYLKVANQALPATPVPPAAEAPTQIQVVEAPPPGDAVAAGFREEPLPAPEAEAEAPEPETLPIPPVAVAKAAPAPVPEPPKIVVLNKPSDGACTAQPTPADRAICADPELRRLQRELRTAYGEALEAHEDRGLLRQRQLAWRDARNTVDDPARLANLYEARIRKLHAAAEAAREGR